MKITSAASQEALEALDKQSEAPETMASTKQQAKSNMRADAPSFKPMEPANVDAGHLTFSAGCVNMYTGAISYVHAMSRISSDHSGPFQ